MDEFNLLDEDESDGFTFGKVYSNDGEEGGRLVECHAVASGVLVSGARMVVMVSPQMDGFSPVPLIGASEESYGSGVHHFICRFRCPGSGNTNGPYGVSQGETNSHHKLGAIGVLPREGPLLGWDVYIPCAIMEGCRSEEEVVVGIICDVDERILFVSANSHTYSMSITFAKTIQGDVRIAVELASKMANTQRSSLCIRECDADEWTKTLGEAWGKAEDNRAPVVTDDAPLPVTSMPSNEDRNGLSIQRGIPVTLTLHGGNERGECQHFPPKPSPQEEELTEEFHVVQETFSQLWNSETNLAREEAESNLFLKGLSVAERVRVLSSRSALKAMEDTCKRHPRVWNKDAIREFVKGCFLCIGTTVLLGQVQSANDAHAAGLAVSILFLEKYNSSQPDDSIMVTDREFLKMRNVTDGCKHSLLRFYSKRAPCSCLKEMYAAAVKSHPKTGICDGCGERKIRSELRVCDSCRGQQYCSRKCQAAHWPEHDKLCSKGILYLRVPPSQAMPGGGDMRGEDVGGGKSGGGDVLGDYVAAGGGEGKSPEGVDVAPSSPTPSTANLAVNTSQALYDSPMRPIEFNPQMDDMQARLLASLEVSPVKKMNFSSRLFDSLVPGQLVAMGELDAVGAGDSGGEVDGFSEFGGVERSIRESVGAGERARSEVDSA